MPKIMKTSEQETALRTIIDDLKIIDRLNKVIENVEILEAGMVTVQADNAKISLTLPASVVNKLLGDNRKEKVSEVKVLARKYNITLDDADKQILGVGAQKVATEIAQEKTESAVTEDDEKMAEEVSSDIGVDEDTTESAQTYTPPYTTNTY